MPGQVQPPPQGAYQGYQNQQGYGGYQQGYPPQQGVGGQYNANVAKTRKKGTSPAVLGAIIAVAVALLAGGVLLYFFLQPKSSNTLAISGTPQPTTAALVATTGPGQPTPRPSNPTTAPKRTPLRSTPTTLPREATSVPVQGGVGFDGTPHDAANAFFNNLKSGNYEAARSLLSPELAIGLDVATLKSLWESLTSAGGSVTVGNATESGNTAEVDITFDIGFGITQAGKARLIKQGGRWFLENPFNFDSTQPIGIPTFEPGTIPGLPTFEPIEIPTP